MTPEQQQHHEQVHAEARALIEYAASKGIVLTIETRPKKPLAMGNYDFAVETRDAHPKN